MNKMDEKIDLLALSRSLDDICIDHDIEPRVVIYWLLEEGMITLDEYFEDEEEE